MSENEPVSLDALNGLLKERKRYEEWLAALEAKRASTTESVYQRVQADYEIRLRDVSGKLAERAGELRESIDVLSARLEEVSRQEVQQREARQEAELRAAVGEYTEKQWKEIGSAWDKELGRLAKERTALDAQLGELTRIFTLSVKEQAPKAPTPAAAPPPGPQAASRPPISPVVPRAAPRIGAIGNQPEYIARSAVPEPPTLNPPSRVDHPSPAPQSGQSSSSTATPRSPFDQFQVLRPTGGGGGGAPGAAGSTPTPASTVAIATPPSVPKTGGAQDPRSEQHKTLRCPECGTSNYPTEWYCEHCGGELATM